MKSVHAILCLSLEAGVVWSSDWIWGLPLIVLTLIIHVFGLGFISQRAILLNGGGQKRRRHPHITFGVVLGSSALLATVLHAIETGIWALAYCALGALPDYRDGMLYSLGAMTTYGHQDIFLAPHWRLMGSLEALNGWLLFGLSTAFLFWLFQEVTPKKRTGGE